MNIYRISIQHPDEGTIYAWAGSMADAWRAARELNARCRAVEPMDKATVTPVDFPTKKMELLSWLNAYFDRNND